MERRLGVGFIGSGFITKFHIRSWEAVREADVRGVWSPNRANAEEAAALARTLRVGEAQAFDSIEAMVADENIDAIWICGPNFARIDNMSRIVAAMKSGRGCVRWPARSRSRATPPRRGGWWSSSRTPACSTAISRINCSSRASSAGKQIVWARGAAAAGRPYLARAAEEHSGPHMPWFWQGDLQGGGVLNDMMCHSLEVGRYLLTAPGAPRDSIRPVRCRRRSPLSSGRARNTRRCSVR